MGFDEINGRLEEADQNLLAQAVLNEDGEVTREEIIAAVVSMQRSEQHNLRAELKSRIGEAERAGHFDEAVRPALSNCRVSNARSEAGGHDNSRFNCVSRSSVQ